MSKILITTNTVTTYALTLSYKQAVFLMNITQDGSIDESDENYTYRKEIFLALNSIIDVSDGWPSSLNKDKI